MGRGLSLSVFSVLKFSSGARACIPLAAQTGLNPIPGPASVPGKRRGPRESLRGGAPVSWGWCRGPVCWKMLGTAWMMSELAANATAADVYGYSCVVCIESSDNCHLRKWQQLVIKLTYVYLVSVE
jgi:hypothetical protein